MFQSRILQEDLLKLTPLKFPGTIHVIETEEQAEIVAAELLNEQFLGFDTESRPTFTKGEHRNIALIQLATDENAYLFRCCKFKTFPPTLKKLLSSPNPLKIGTAIKNDLSIIDKSKKKCEKIAAQAFVELQNMVKDFGLENYGLSKMTGIILGHRVSKSQQLTNWENEILTPAQQHYAAVDAWACLKIYQKLLETRKAELQ